MTETIGTMESCNCKKCTSFCTHRPGWFMPGEAEKAAQIMGISLNKLFEHYLVVDWWYGSDDFEFATENVYLLAPGLVEYPTGAMAQTNPQGQCRFYSDKQGCLIHTDKPYECLHTWHDSTEQEIKVIRKAVVQAWAEYEIPLLNKLLGCAPVASEPDMFDFVSMLMGGMA